MPVATLNYGESPHSNASYSPIHHRQPHPIPPREFLVQLEIWSPQSSTSSTSPSGASKSKPSKSSKSSKSRPSSSIFSPSNGSGSGLSQDDVHSLHPVTSNTDAFSINSGLTSNTAYSGYSTGAASAYSNSSKKSGLSTLFGGKGERTGNGGSWRPVVCKLSGEGGYTGYNNSGYAAPTSSGQALLTIYSSEDNTLQHVINVHKLTSTDIRAVDKSLFVRQDVLGIFTHPSAISLSTISSTSLNSASPNSNPILANGNANAVEPIYLAFPNTDAHNTWLVLLRSYTSPEVYGRMINAEQGGLYRMWRQIELRVIQSKGSLTVPNSNSPAAPGGGNATNAAGPQFTTTQSTTANGTGNGGRPPMERTISSGTNGSTMNGAEVVIPLGLTKSHAPSINTTITTSTTTSNASSGTCTSPSGTVMTGGGGTTSSLKSYSTTSLPSVDTTGSNESTPANGQSTPRPHSNSTSASASNPNLNQVSSSSAGTTISAKEKEKREKKEREKAEKERKNLLKAPGMFCEVVLDGEVCARTTVKRPPLHHINSFSAASSNQSNSGGGNGNGSNGPSSGINGEWIEDFLFGDLPSFGNLVITLWRAPESSGWSSKKSDDRPKSAGRGTSSNPSTSTNGISSSTSASTSGSTSTGFTTSTTSVPSSATTFGSSSAPGNVNLGLGGASGGGLVGVVGGIGGAVGGGIKGATYLGSVEIALPNFRRGEWVEGWWPVYSHAIGSGASNNNGLNSLNSMGMGTAAMGLGGMSGIGGVSGALVQIGELRLKIKVDEEIILPSRAYKNVLDALEQRNYLDALSDLEQKLRIDHAMIAPHIVSLAVARNRLLKDIVKLAEREIMGLVSTNTLFRGNTVLTKTMELAMAWYGKAFLDASVGPVIRRMIAENVEFEIDPSRLHPPGSKRPSTRDSSYRPSTKESYRPSSAGGIGISFARDKDRVELDRDSMQEQGLKSLEYWCAELWNQIYNVRMECPVELRRLFGHIRALVEAKYGAARQANLSPDPMHHNPSSTNPASAGNNPAGMLPWQAISSFVFLRYIVPPLLNPHLHGICPGMPPKGVARSLTLLAKCTQSLANLNPGAMQKEEYMRGIKDLLERNMETMIDYLACVSTLPDQFSPTANASSFLSGPDKHDRLHVINSLRERLTGTGGNSIPTLYKDAIPLLPYALDVPKHLAILSSAVVRNARTGTTAAAAYGGRGGISGMDEQDASGWTLAKFSELCFDVEAQALKSVATLAQGAASAGAFGSRTKRSTSVSSYQQSVATPQQQQGQGQGQSSSPLTPISASAASAISSRGVTPTASGNGGISAITPTQMPPSPWTSHETKRPSSSRSTRSITTPTAATVPHNGSPTSNHSGSPNQHHVTFPGTPSPPSASDNSLRREGKEEVKAPTTTKASILSHAFSAKRKKSARPSTAPSSTSTSQPSGRIDTFPYDHSNTKQQQQQQLALGRPIIPSERRMDDLTVPDTPTSTKSGNSSSSQRFAYSAESAGGYAISTDEQQRRPTTHRLGSETYIAFHYPTSSSNSPTVPLPLPRYHSIGQSSSSSMNLPQPSMDRQKGERSSSIANGRNRDVMKRPSTASGPTTPARATQFPFNDPETEYSPTSPGMRHGPSTPGDEIARLKEWRAMEEVRLREWRNGQPGIASPAPPSSSGGRRSFGNSSGEGQAPPPPPSASKRSEGAGSGGSSGVEGKKKKGFFGWLKK